MPINIYNDSKGFKMFFKITLASLLLISFSSCTSPTIKYNNKHKLEIVLDNKTIIEGLGTLSYENRVNLININIYQRVLNLDNDTIITYENVDISTGYRLTYGINRTVGIIFPEFNYALIATHGNLHFFKLFNSNGSLYLIVENMNKKGLRLVYGMPKTTFEAIQIAINKNRSVVIPTISGSKPKNSITKKIASSYVKSGWSNKNIILDTMITKIGHKKPIKYFK